MYWISAMKDSHGFWVKVTEDFNQFNGCEDDIRSGFAALDKMAKDKDWGTISEVMRTCKPIGELRLDLL